jgi:hypothetical protein
VACDLDRAPLRVTPNALSSVSPAINFDRCPACSLLRGVHGSIKRRAMRTRVFTCLRSLRFPVPFLSVPFVDRRGVSFLRNISSIDYPLASPVISCSAMNAEAKLGWDIGRIAESCPNV